MVKIRDRKIEVKNLHTHKSFTANTTPVEFRGAGVAAL